MLFCNHYLLLVRCVVWYWHVSCPAVTWQNYWTYTHTRERESERASERTHVCVCRSLLHFKITSHFVNVHMYPLILLKNHSFGIPMKLVRLIKMCLNKTYSTVQLGKHLSDMSPIKNGLKQGDALLPLLFNFDLD